MSDTLLAQIPLIDMADQSRDPQAFAAALGASFERFGFAMVSGHGVPQQVIDRAWAQTKAFFDLPEEEKRSYFVAGGGGARGYTPFKTEIAKGATHVDLKEFWHIGRELPDGHRFSDSMSPNIWPARPEGFRETFLDLFAALDTAGDKLLSAIALHLGLASDWFDPAVKDGNSVLRLLHYPPVTEDAPNVRAGAHEDINLITLLLGAEEAGLELLDKQSGEWLPVKPPEGAMVVNVGDMLQRLTNHVLPSTTHRVVNPPVERRGHSRYSMPFFLHPAPDFLIKALPQCISDANPEREPPITAHDYLAQRLAEIGLTKK
ncbi:isopenicillin N synthase family dioxygenase [Sphingomonas turrisvirgatae]|uniref:2-oxoglutarate-dependent ethylene/succinate-forming enzyme n=1 Tax=Sphingomonas turrisvirgatae TaxID=1888892 RepID=A0A1E3M157_9SPHN|nr:2-oxoglutarate and iron-dependent oxygenase domain-containing protein [Sphingomonas turrisvirgatae]ODP39661.1 flavonol synthase [Sphingomonas turrisvirgatae]